MELPELRMTFADRADLLRELDQNLRHGRAFLSQQTDIPVLSECVLVLIHPDHAQELRLTAQIVMVNASGTGVSLAGSYTAELERLRTFAEETARQPSAAPEPDAPEAARITIVPGTPEEGAAAMSGAFAEPLPLVDASDDAARVTFVPPRPDDADIAARVTYVPELPAAEDEGAADVVDDDPGRVTYVPDLPPDSTAPSEPARITYVPDAPERAQEDAPAAPAEREEAEPVAAAPYLEIGEPLDEASFADVEQQLAAESSSAPPPPQSLSELPEPDLEAEPELEQDALEAGSELSGSGPSSRPIELQQGENRQERLRHLNAAQQLKVARTGELADRIAVERLYGKQVWEALLHNPRLSIPEVARIARKGTVPKPLLDVILDNAAWIKADAVRRALLSNPKIGQDAVLKLLRATPKHELKMIEKGTAYGAAVRESARKLLRQ